MGSADLSLSCLLDDLLAEQGEDKENLSPRHLGAMGSISENAPMDYPDGTMSPEKEAALLAEQEEQARQLAELCGEMDSCLASLGDWERRHEAGMDVLKRQLEEQYGFSYEEAISSGALGASMTAAMQAALHPDKAYGSDDESDGPDMCAQLIDEGSNIGEAAKAKQEAQKARGLAAAPAGAAYKIASGQLTAQLSVASSRDPVSSTSIPLPPNGSVEQLLEDEERLARLRQEVEILRQRELAVARVSAGESTPLTEGLIEDLNMEGLSQWCSDVEHVLGSNGEVDINQLGDLDLATLDARLVDAHKHANIMQNAMDDVKSRLDDELNDLDAMMAECNAMQAKMALAQ